MQMVVAFIFNYLLVRFFKSASDNVFICIFIFFCTKWYVYNFEVLRESICVVLILNAIVEYFKSRHIKSFLLWSTPAIFIHWFALFMVLLFLLALKINIKLNIIISVFLSVLIMFLDFSNFELLLGYFLVQQDSFAEYNKYLMSFHEGSYNIYFFINLILTNIIPPLILLRRYINKNINNKLEQSMIRLLPLYLVIGVSTSKLVIAYRLFNYIYPIYLVFVIKFLFEEYINKRRFPKVITARRLEIIVLFVCFSFSIYRDIKSFLYPDSVQDEGNYDIRYIPYTSVFQEPNQERTIYYDFWRNWD